MPRFRVNRWWTLILALCLGVVLAASWSTRATAEARMFDELGQRSWSNGGGGVPPPPGDGDPDIPMSRTKRALPSASSGQAAALSTGRAVGDGAQVGGVMMWHFSVVLQSLRLWGFVRF
jgi:hypothetical protein